MLLPLGGNVETGVAWGKATETSNGGKLKYELLGFCSTSSAKTVLKK
jgi:hypothetical protein